MDDSNHVRPLVFGEIARQRPRFDATLLYKPNAYPSVRDRGEMYLYQLAWHLPLKEVIQRVSCPDDRIYVIVASLGTNKRAGLARSALSEVCSQTGRSVVLCVWDSATAWGLQLADYALWAIHRRQRGRGGSWWDQYIRPSTATVFFPWRAHHYLAWR